jgi:hypothetical protein
MVKDKKYIDTEETYFIKDVEYTKCCDYPIIYIQNKQREKIKHCNQCLKEIKND